MELVIFITDRVIQFLQCLFLLILLNVAYSQRKPVRTADLKLKKILCSIYRVINLSILMEN